MIVAVFNSFEGKMFAVFHMYYNKNIILLMQNMLNLLNEAVIQTSLALISNIIVLNKQLPYRIVDHRIITFNSVFSYGAILPPSCAHHISEIKRKK